MLIYSPFARNCTFLLHHNSWACFLNFKLNSVITIKQIMNMPLPYSRRLCLPWEQSKLEWENHIALDKTIDHGQRRVPECLKRKVYTWSVMKKRKLNKKATSLPLSHWSLDRVEPFFEAWMSLGISPSDCRSFYSC